MFTPQTIAGFITAAVLAVMIPLTTAVIFKKKSSEAKVSDFFTGSAVFILFALILEQILHSAVRPMIMDNAAAYVIYGALAAGVFEECGRFAAYKTVLKDRKSVDNAVMTGIGHGGCECILLMGVSMLGAVIVAVCVNRSGFDAVVERGSAGNPMIAELAAQQISAYADVSFGQAMLSVFERILAMVFHISASVIVFEGSGRKISMLPLAILLHALLDTPAALFQQGIIPLPATYGAMVVIDAVAVIIAIGSYKRMKEAGI